MVEIILYNGGAAGDMVAAVIDPREYIFEGDHLAATTVDRIKLRHRIQLTMTDEERDIYIATTPYYSLACHLADYLVSRKHDFILIDSSDREYAKWASNRLFKIWGGKFPWFQEPHEPESHEILYNRASPFTNRVITLKDILEGNLIKRLENLTDKKLHGDIYKKWLELNIFP